MPEIRQCFGTAPSGRPLAERLHATVFDGYDNAVMALAVVEVGIHARKAARDLERILDDRKERARIHEIAREELRRLRGDAMLAAAVGLTVVKGGA